MDPFRALSTSDQLAEYLRRQIRNGILTGTLPGTRQLVQSLGVNSVAVSKAVQQLEHEGLVIHQGDRRSRLIARSGRTRLGTLRIGMLYYDPSSSSRHDSLLIKQGLVNAGHTVINAPKSMLELEMNMRRTARMIDSIDVDAWIIFAGSSEILGWFEQRNIPSFALHGRLDQVDMAGIGVHKAPVYVTLIQKLVSLGHTRITMLAREERKKPILGALEQFFIEQLQQHGIQTGAYNIPDWVDTPEGLEKVIHALFKFTPPTALIVGDSTLFHAVQVHLAQKGIFAPKHISLFCNDVESSFDWVRPDIAHIVWDYRPTIRRALQWAKNISIGKTDRKKTYIKASLHEGATLGPVP